MAFAFGRPGATVEGARRALRVLPLLRLYFVTVRGLAAAMALDTRERFATERRGTISAERQRVADALDLAAGTIATTAGGAVLALVGVEGHHTTGAGHGHAFPALVAGAIGCDPVRLGGYVAGFPEAVGHDARAVLQLVARAHRIARTIAARPTTGDVPREALDGHPSPAAGTDARTAVRQ